MNIDEVENISLLLSDIGIYIGNLFFFISFFPFFFVWLAIILWYNVIIKQSFKFIQFDTKIFIVG